MYVQKSRALFDGEYLVRSLAVPLQFQHEQHLKRRYRRLLKQLSSGPAARKQTRNPDVNDFDSRSTFSYHFCRLFVII